MFQQRGKGNVPSDGCVRQDVDPEAEDEPYLAVDRGLGQPEVRDGLTRHAPGDGGSLEDVHRVPEQGGKVGAGQPCGAGTDDGDPLAGRGKALHAPEGGTVIRGMPFQRADCHAFIVRIPVAAGFAGMGAYAARHAGKRIAGAQVFQREGLVAVRNGPFHFLNGVPRRAAAFTGGRPALSGVAGVLYGNAGCFSAKDWRHS